MFKVFYHRFVLLHVCCFVPSTEGILPQIKKSITRITLLNVLFDK